MTSDSCSDFDKNKINQLRQLIPSYWNSYEQMLSVRLTAIRAKLNFLLIVLAAFFTISITLYIEFVNNQLILNVLMIQFAVFVILFRAYNLPMPDVYWIAHHTTKDKNGKECVEALELIDNNEFEVDLIDSLKTIEDQSFSYMRLMKRIEKQVFKLILISVLLLVSSIVIFKFIIFIFSMIPLLVDSIGYFKAVEFFTLFPTGMYTSRLCYKYITLDIQNKSSTFKYKRDLIKWLKVKNNSNF